MEFNSRAYEADALKSFLFCVLENIRQSGRPCDEYKHAFTCSWHSKVGGKDSLWENGMAKWERQ